MAGRPPGSENKNKRFKAALVRYAESHPDRLDQLAEKLWAQAMGGDTTSIVAIADRLDGKPAQAIVGDDELDPIRTITEVKRTIVDAPNPDSPGIPAAAGTDPV